MTRFDFDIKIEYVLLALLVLFLWYTMSCNNKENMEVMGAGGNSCPPGQLFIDGNCVDDGAGGDGSTNGDGSTDEDEDANCQDGYEWNEEDECCVDEDGNCIQESE
jgi:hypothetical protein